MIFQQAFLRKRPESLDIIDVHFSIRESLSIIDSSAFEPIRDKAIITTEFISVNVTSKRIPSHSLKFFIRARIFSPTTVTTPPVLLRIPPRQPQGHATESFLFGPYHIPGPRRARIRPCSRTIQLPRSPDEGSRVCSQPMYSRCTTAQCCPPGSPRGHGKTTSVKRIFAGVDETSRRMIAVYVNCQSERTLYAILSQIHSRLFGHFPPVLGNPAGNSSTRSGRP